MYSHIMAPNKKSTGKKNGHTKVDKNNKQIHTAPIQRGPNDHMPFVSICTPTFNRRPFWPMAIKCFEEYDYPKDRMEWIILDDGSDKIEDLVSHIPQVKYFKYDKQMILGKKRNLMHEKTKGDIIIYQDDDDYYPPERVPHAVQTLTDNPKALCAGASVVFVYFKHIQQMYRFGPYGPNHATAGTFAFRRELLKQTKYDDFKALAEEKDFLKGYTIPFVQMDPLKTILVFSHDHNTIDKRDLLVNAPNPTCNPDMNVKVEDFVKSKSAYKFFMKDIDVLLADYSPGEVKHKEEVINQIRLLKEGRAKQTADNQKLHNETMQREEVKKIIEASNQRVEAERLKAIAAIIKSKKLLERVREYEKRFASEIGKITTNEDIDREVANQEIPINLVLKKAEFNVIQREETGETSIDVINNIMNFITHNNIEMILEVNGTDVTISSDKNELSITPIKVDEWKDFNMKHAQQQGMNPNPMNHVVGVNTNITRSVNATEEETTVMTQTGCNHATATKALGATGNDVIDSIINIDQYTTEENAVTNENATEEETTVMMQTGCNHATATKALGATGNDVIESIINIDQYTTTSTNVKDETKDVAVEEVAVEEVAVEEVVTEIVPIDENEKSV